MKPRVVLVLALVAHAALVAACGPGVGEPPRAGARTTDARTERASSSTDARSSTSDRSSSSDRSKGHAGNGKR